jgi:NAD(P)-dependent dehydrogenase (short-subunit alcohol dehydrogenase family)
MESDRLLARRTRRDGYVTDIDDVVGRDTVERIRAKEQPTHFLHHDVADEAAWASVVAHVHGRQGRIDVLVNDAGLYLIQPLEETSLECARKIFDTNVFGVWLGMRHVAPVMAAGAGGSIINLASMDATVGASGFTAYGGPKGAVTTMTRDAAIRRVGRAVPGERRVEVGHRDRAAHRWRRGGRLVALHRALAVRDVAAEHDARRGPVGPELPDELLQ